MSRAPVAASARGGAGLNSGEHERGRICAACPACWGRTVPDSIRRSSPMLAQEQGRGAIKPAHRSDNIAVRFSSTIMSNCSGRIRAHAAVSMIFSSDSISGKPWRHCGSFEKKAIRKLICRLVTAVTSGARCLAYSKHNERYATKLFRLISEALDDAGNDVLEAGIESSVFSRTITRSNRNTARYVRRVLPANVGI